MLTLVGLGPYGIDAMSVMALRALESAKRIYLRTGSHPAADELEARGIDFKTFDGVYEKADDFEEVYSSIAEEVMKMARDDDLVYAVPGHPLIAERSVTLLIESAARQDIDFRFAPSPSFIEACLEAIAAPVDTGIKLIDALAIDLVPPSPECANLVHQVYDRFTASSLKLALMDIFPDECEVTIISGAGGPDVTIDKRPLYTLDRREYDHLTSLYIAEERNCVERNR